MSSASRPAVAAAPTAHFTRDTAVDRVGPGRYGATLRDEWSLLHPQGGIVAVVGLRAMLAGYASVEMTLWDDDRLVAYATQMMVFSFPDGPPSPEQIRPPR